MKKLLFVLLLGSLLAGCGEKAKEVTSNPLLIECEACEKKISKISGECPNCGHPTAATIAAIKKRKQREKEPGRKNESELPPGKPSDQLVERAGLYFLGEDETPFTGVVEERNNNGKRTRLVSFTNGLRDGAEYRFDSNGFVLQEAKFSKGTLDGKQIFWWPNGAKKEERVWVKGNPHPRELRRWDQDGRLIEEKIDDSF